MTAAPHLAQVPDIDALQFLTRLGQLNIPVWTATTGTSGREVNRPTGWQDMTADTNRERLSTWRPGMAFSGNMGGQLVVLDGDTRNGCNIAAVEAMLDGINATVYAAVDTPSGGRHWYLPGHPDLPTIHATTDRDGFTGYPGLELISYGANVFLPGTQRPKYGGKGYTILYDRLEQLAEQGGDPETAENLAAWVAAHRRTQPEPFTPATPWDGTPPDARQQRYLDATLSNTARRAADAPAGERNTRLFHAAMCLGNYITGAGLDETAAIAALQAAAATSGLTRDDGPGSVNATIQSGLRFGKSMPRAVPDPTHQQVTGLTIDRTPQPWDQTNAPNVAPPFPTDRMNHAPATDAGHAPDTPQDAHATSTGTPSTNTASSGTDDDPAGRARNLWPRIDWHQLWADDTEQEWILEPILPAGRLISLYSPPKVGKSLLMLEMAVHVSKGTPFLLGTPERRYRVLYVDFENDPRGDIRTRLENMRYQPDDLDHLDYLSYPTIAAFDTQRGGLELVEAVKAYGSEVVIVDTISRAVSGEENSNDTWLAFYRNTGFLLKQMGVSLIRLDHTGKDVEKGQRGGSAKSGDVDAIWKLTTITRDELYRLECTDARMQVDVKELTIRRHDWPLRHTIETMPATTTGDEKKRHALTLLAEAGIPVGASRREVAKYLRGQGVKLSTTALSQVTKQWHQTTQQPVDNSTKPVEKWSRTTPLEQVPRGPVQSGPGPLRTTEDHLVQNGTTLQVNELVHGPLGLGTTEDRTPPDVVVPIGPPPSGGPRTTSQDQTKNQTSQNRAQPAPRVITTHVAGHTARVNLDTGEVVNP